MLVAFRQQGGRRRDALFARQRGGGRGLLHQQPQPLQHLDLFAGGHHVRAEPLGRLVAAEDGLVPGAQQLAVRLLARLQADPLEAGPGLLAADVLVGLVDQRLQLRRGVAELVAAIEQLHGRFPLLRTQQLLDLVVGVGQVAQRRHLVHADPAEGQQLLGRLADVAVGRVEQVDDTAGWSPAAWKSSLRNNSLS